MNLFDRENLSSLTIESEPDYGRSPCANCFDPNPGIRYSAVGWNKKYRQALLYEICEDCAAELSGENPESELAESELAELSF